MFDDMVDDMRRHRSVIGSSLDHHRSVNDAFTVHDMGPNGARGRCLVGQVGFRVVA
jgi:hypothetical protein